MSWKLDGTYFENCNCDWVCPCAVSSLTAPSTNDRCQFVLVYHVDAGQVEGLEVGGLTVAVVADAPKMMTDGNWRVGLLIDDKASKEQHEALTGVFAGQKGGPMGAIAPLIGEVVGIESQPIEYESSRGKHSVRIGSGVEIDAEDFIPDGMEAPTQLVGIFHPSNTTLNVAKPTRSKISAFDMTFKNEGKSAFSAPFNWAG